VSTLLVALFIDDGAVFMVCLGFERLWIHFLGLVVAFYEVFCMVFMCIRCWLCLWSGLSFVLLLG